MAPLKNQIQRLTAWVFEDEDRSPFVTTESKRPGCPSRIEFGGELVFVLQAPDTLRRRLFPAQCHYQDG